MELGALTGHGPRELVAGAARDPVIAPRRVVVLGHRHPDDLEDARELDLVDEAIECVDAHRVRSEGPGAVAARAARQLDASTDGAWLHLDLYVLDRDALPAVSYPQRGGLDWGELSELIAPLVASERLVGMSVGVPAARVSRSCRQAEPATGWMTRL